MKASLSATIIVGEPKPLVEGVHDRMPVILMPEEYERWLDPETPPGELKALLKPFPTDKMEAFEVSRDT